MAFLTDLLADGIELLRRERALANTRAVSFDNTDYLVDLVWSNTGTNADAAGDRMRSRNIRIRTIVDIQHRSLCTLEEDLAAGFDLVIQQCNRIADVRTQTIGIAHVFLQDFIIVQRLMIVKQLQLFILDRQVFLQALCEFLTVHQIADADTDTVVAVHVARADTTFRRTNLVLATGLITDTIHQTMIRQYHMRAVRDADTRHIDATGRQAIHLFQHDHRVESNAITDDAMRSLEQDTRRHQTKLIGLAVHYNRMTGIAAALETDNRVRLLCQIIDDLTFALVAPLSTSYNYC